MGQTNIEHPDYYIIEDNNGCELEAIDVIEALGYGKGFELGNAIKYIFRAGRKDGEDTKTAIEKAIWYLSRFINYYSQEEDMKNGG